ncbi:MULTISPECIES: hypothetical protein [unclassified Sporosarcina]|nr:MULTISPECIES: hypothetical protein [unclassified Sporosarcina]
MAEKKSGLKKLFSKPKKDCCSVEIEEVKSTENDKNSQKQQKKED